MQIVVRDNAVAIRVSVATILVIRVNTIWTNLHGYVCFTDL